MKYIKSRQQVLLEGAKLNSTKDLAILDIKNIPNDPNELLKTNIFNKKLGFKSLGIIKESFNVYYGLELAEEIPSTGSELKLIMNNLKKSLIDGGMEKLKEFIVPSIKQMGHIDYVISLESSESLSFNLAKIVNLYTNAKIIKLGKDKHENIGSAIDWEYIESHENRVGDISKKTQTQLKSVLPRLITIIKNEIKSTSELITYELDKISKTADSKMFNDGDLWKKLKGLLLISNKLHPKYKEEYSIEWKNPIFKIRTSGETFGGSRKFFKSKYEIPKDPGQYGDPIFRQLIEDCIFNNKHLLFVDDNTRTKEDLLVIFSTIKTIADNIIFDRKIENPVSQTYSKRISAYVLIYAGTSKLANKKEVETFKHGS